MLTNNYDLNIYAIDGTVMLIPYRTIRDSDGLLRIDYFNNLTSLRLDLYMNRDEHYDAIEWALDSEDWDKRKSATEFWQDWDEPISPAKYWDELDVWTSTDTLRNDAVDDRIPEPLRSWLSNLPNYWVADGTDKA